MAAGYPSEMFYVPGGMKSCFNCVYNAWEQPADRTTIQQCSRCKIVSYCSKQCQQEHWMKVHKQHCKYMAKEKVMPQSLHDESTCPICKTEKETGVVEMSRSDNPVLGCHLKNQAQPQLFKDDGCGFLAVPLPFPLGEMSGTFVTKVEATLSLLMRIMHKMKLTKHLAWSINTKISEAMMELLKLTRTACWNGYLLANPGTRLDKAHGFAINNEVHEIERLIVKVDQLLGSAKYKDSNQFRPWDTFKMLASFLAMHSIEQDRYTTECVGLPEMTEDRNRMRVASSQFADNWKGILNTMGDGLVKYSELVEVLCGGKLRQTCYGCSKKVTVAEVILIDFCDTEGMEYGRKVPFLIYGVISVSFCSKQVCLRRLGWGEVFGLMKLYGRTGCEASQYTCDFCALPGGKGNRGHRCSRCLTKVYCGDECRNMDWVVHKLVCREGEDERKLKGGQHGRKKEGKKLFENVVNTVDTTELEFLAEKFKLMLKQ